MKCTGNDLFALALQAKVSGDLRTPEKGLELIAIAKIGQNRQDRSAFSARQENDPDNSGGFFVFSLTTPLRNL
ncbi:MAG: hypothetical protein KatS3mg105_2144 [Gemmatales bacterium]|nr:MAG: hypothetical protein KatS3mg105_2144 [Gemmatales bacterium]